MWGAAVFLRFKSIVNEKKKKSLRFWTSQTGSGNGSLRELYRKRAIYWQTEVNTNKNVCLYQKCQQGPKVFTFLVRMLWRVQRENQKGTETERECVARWSLTSLATLPSANGLQDRGRGVRACWLRQNNRLLMASAQARGNSWASFHHFLTFLRLKPLLIK